METEECVLEVGGGTGQESFGLLRIQSASAGFSGYGTCTPAQLWGQLHTLSYYPVFRQDMASLARLEVQRCTESKTQPFICYSTPTGVISALQY